MIMTKNAVFVPSSMHRSSRWLLGLYGVFLGVFLAFAGTAFADWPETGGGALSDRGRAVVIGQDGSIYAAGTIQGEAAFGDFTSQFFGAEDIVVVKYSPAGEVVAMVSAGSDGRDQVGELAIDLEDNLYLTGSYSGGRFRFGGNELEEPVDSSTDSFVAKLDSDLNWQWAARESLVQASRKS